MKAWVAKDCDNDIYLMNRHPTKEYETWIDGGFIIPIEKKDLPQDVDPQWEDTEPIEVNVNITKASDDVVTIPKDRYEQLLQYEQEYISRQSMINSFMQNK